MDFPNNDRGYKLADVIAVLARIAANDFDDWCWARNTRCKYVGLHFDTRDGGYVRITDRDGKPISLDDLAFQYRGEATQ